MEKTRLEKEAEAREQMKDHLSTPEGEDKRFDYTRKKRSQDDNAIANVVTIKDRVTGRKYTVSVNASVTGGIDDELLVNLQSYITKLLLNIHEQF